MFCGVEWRFQLTTASFFRSKFAVLGLLLLGCPSFNACTGPRGEQTITSSQASSQLATVVVKGEPTRASVMSEARESVFQVKNTRSCMGALERNNLDQGSWFEAAAQACYQGSSLQGGIIVESVSRGRTVSLDVPPQLHNSCWIAVIAKDDSPPTPVTFELVDADGARSLLGSVTENLNVLPAKGPYCSVGGHVRQLAATTGSDVSVMFRLAWYSVVPVQTSAER